MNFRMVLIFIFFGSVSAQNAKITATEQFTVGIDPIQIDCQPAGSLYAQINALAILKKNQTFLSLEKVNERTSICWADLNTQRRSTTNNSNLDTVSSALLTVIIPAGKTQDDDKALYTCRVNGSDSNSSTVPNNEVSQLVSVLVMTTTVSPSTTIITSNNALVTTNVSLSSINKVPVTTVSSTSSNKDPDQFLLLVAIIGGVSSTVLAVILVIVVVVFIVCRRQNKKPEGSANSTASRINHTYDNLDSVVLRSGVNMYESSTNPGNTTVQNEPSTVYSNTNTCTDLDTRDDVGLNTYEPMMVSPPIVPYRGTVYVNTTLGRGDRLKK